MIKINTMKELRAVIEGGFKFLGDSFNDGKVICHPIAPITFLPSNLKFIPPSVRRGVAVGWILIYSNDGRTWTYNFREVYNKAINHEGQFYISDWKLNILFNVEYYMMDEVSNLLTTVFDEYTLIEKFKWKQAEIGQIHYFDFKEYFSE